MPERRRLMRKDEPIDSLRTPAYETVRPALTKFYGALSDEQKARFDRLGARPT
jgi:LTXXQ motif family protein